jgi:hypothetical protein
VFHPEDLSLDESARRLTEVKCTLCQPPIYICLKWCGSTSNMIGHIKSHNIVLNEDDESEDEGEDIMAQMGEEFAHKSVEKQKKRTEKMNSALLLMLINCAFAFNVVTNPHFGTFVNMLNPTFVVPSPYILSNSYLDKEYMLVMGNLRKDLDVVSSVSVTLDPWT